MRRVLLLAAMGLLLACNKVKEPPSSNTTLVPASQSARPAPAPEPVIDLESLPVSEDYELDAEKEITSANLSKKVDELEKEIAGD